MNPYAVNRLEREERRGEEETVIMLSSKGDTIAAKNHKNNSIYSELLE